MTSELSARKIHSPNDGSGKKMERLLKNIKVDINLLRSQQVKVQRKNEISEKGDISLIQLNDQLANVNVRSIELMSELEDTNEALGTINKELARANAHAAELMAIIELKTDEIEKLNSALANANARSADLVAEREIQMLEVNRLNEKLSNEIKEREKGELRLNDTLDKLERKNQDLDEFNHSVSHDLKSPLTSIAGYTQLLIRRHSGKLDDEDQAYLDKILRCCNNMNVLIKDLLTLSNADNTYEGITEIELASVLKDIIITLKEVDKSRNVKVHYPESLPTIKYNRTNIIQVFSNLISNAIKYMGDQKDPRVDVKYKEGEDEYIFKIIDNGKGIKEKELESIFKPFTRGTSAIKTQGTGVGLSIVKKIVESKKGRIWVRSKYGKGSMFSFTIPKIK